MLAKALFAAIITAMALPVSAQETKTLNLSLGLADAQGRAKIDRTSPLYSALVVVGEIVVDWKNIRTRNKLQAGPDRFGGWAKDLSAEGIVFSAGLVKIGAIGRYFSSEDREVIWDNNNLTVTGRTRKRYLFAGFTSGMGDYNGKNFRITGMVGTTDIYKHILSRTGERELEGSPTLVDKDILPVLLLSGMVSWPNIWRDINIRASVNNIKTVDVKRFEVKNTKELIPENQTIAEIGISKPLNSWLSIGVDGILSTDDTGMIFLGNSASVKLILGL